MIKQAFHRPSHYLLFLLCCMLGSCHCNHKKQIPDVSKVQVDLKVMRFEQDLFHLDTAKLNQQLPALASKYGSFYDLWVTNIMLFRGPKDSVDHSQESIKKFLTNRSDCMLYDTVQKHYADFSAVHKELEQSFKFYKYYFPEKHIPIVVTEISEFGNGIFTVDSSYLGIGLDLFLGDQYIYYPEFFPNYMCAKLKKEFIVPNAMKVMYNNEYGDPYNVPRNCVNTMIEVGKQQYFLDLVMPEKEDEYKFGYTTKQLEWCKSSEKSIWQYFIDQDVLYKDGQLEVRKYVGEAPSTPGMPPESPGNIGAWVGYRIVCAYMEKAGGKVTPQQLFATDPQVIMTRSGYKPGK